jgi:hypothetical protein
MKASSKVVNCMSFLEKAFENMPTLGCSFSGPGRALDHGNGGD